LNARIHRREALAGKPKQSEQRMCNVPIDAGRQRTAPNVVLPRGLRHEIRLPLTRLSHRRYFDGAASGLTARGGSGQGEDGQGTEGRAHA
jgi:hypothetical protein